MDYLAYSDGRYTDDNPKNNIIIRYLRLSNMADVPSKYDGHVFMFLTNLIRKPNVWRCSFEVKHFKDASRDIYAEFTIRFMPNHHFQILGHRTVRRMDSGHLKMYQNGKAAVRDCLDRMHADPDFQPLLGRNKHKGKVESVPNDAIKKGTITL